MSESNPLIVWLWAILATLGGAVSSFSFRPYKEMTWTEITLAFCVSSTFSIFVGSFVAELASRAMFGQGPINLRAFGAVMWFMATSSHFLIPVAITRAKRFVAALGATESGK